MVADIDTTEDSPRAPKSAPTGGAPRSRRRAWGIAIAALAAVALAAWAMSSLILAGSEGGDAAIERAQSAAAPGLDALRQDADRRGEELAMNWTAVPDMNESRHLVTVRYRLRPSGESGIAEFMVAGEHVRPQGDLARRLLDGTGQQTP